MNFIYGTKFIEIADIKFCPTNNDLYIPQNTIILSDKVVYTHTHYVNDLFAKLRETDKRIILITHNSDFNVNEILIPDNIIKWYTQNVNYRHEKLFSIPIGLENERWYPELEKTKKIISKLNEEKKIRNLLYINHNVSNNPSERQQPYDLLSNNGFTTIESNANGRMFDEYIDNMHHHKFALCPNGNGIDTHRLWECLYLSTIPIVKRGINTEFYSDLPICYIENYTDITEDFLNSEYNRIKNNKYNLEKLDLNYWRKTICKK